MKKAIFLSKEERRNLFILFDAAQCPAIEYLLHRDEIMAEEFDKSKQSEEATLMRNSTITAYSALGMLIVAIILGLWTMITH